MKNNSTFTAANQRSRAAGRDMMDKHANWYGQYTAQQNTNTTALGCATKLSWIFRQAIAWAVIGVIVALFLTHGGDDAGGVTTIQSFASLGAVVGVFMGLVTRPKRN